MTLCLNEAAPASGAARRVSARTPSPSIASLPRELVFRTPRASHCLSVTLNGPSWRCPAAAAGQITPGPSNRTPAMTCKVNGLFSIGEDFDDEDLLGTDWLAPPSFVPGSGPLPPSSGARQVSAVAPGAQDKGSLPGHLPNGAGSGGRAEAAVGRIATSGLRQISSTSVRRLSLPTSSCPAQPPAINTARPGVALQRSHATREPPQRSFLGEDGFDDWDVDVDLAGLDESDPYTGVGVHNPHTCRAASPLSTAACTEGTISSANKLRYPTSRIQTVTGAAPQTRGLSCRNLAFPPQPPPSLPVASPEFRPRFVPAPSQSTGFVSGFTASPNSIRFPRPLRGSHQALRPWATPGRSPLVRSLFEATSPLASSASPPGFTPRPIHTPVLTNRLVQLVSASNKPLVKRPRCGHRQPKTRRFPGPAGLLPQQPLNQSLDDIVVSVPQTPAHGAVARLPSQCASSQISEEEDFSSGPWAAMKTEMGLDERNLSCFLHSYSVVMVLRKAALKQLVKNKVPNMAVQLKSILHTHADAKAVFKDPTGEIQGTVHRRLLEDRQGELKAGAVLLLKQVGVFSPSHRNHYLNVTSSNLLRIYPPDGASLSSTADLPKLQLKPVSLSTTRSAAIPGGHVSAMQLVFDDDDEEEEEEEEMREESPRVRADRRTSLEEPPPRTYNTTAPEDPAWDADDGLNELLGELLEEHHGL